MKRKIYDNLLKWKQEKHGLFATIYDSAAIDKKAFPLTSHR